MAEGHRAVEEHDFERASRFLREAESLWRGPPLADLVRTVCARGQLMLALYRCGRSADALEVYRAGRLQLSEQLALEPGPALKQLEQSAAPC